jgi:hypothetical protein
MATLLVALFGVLFTPRFQHRRSAGSEDVSSPDVRFPCENCPCGCFNAEFCWDQCCCNSDQEKLAWAIENSVTPPAFLVERVQRNSQFRPRRTSEVPVESAPAGACCAGKAGDKCEAAERDTPTRIAAQDTAAGRPTTKSSLSVVLAWKAAECRGFDWVWTLLSQVYVLPLETFELSCPRLFWHRIEHDRATSLRVAPEPPVP